MTKELLGRHKKNKKELERIDRELERLYGRLEDVQIVSGKVTKSSDDFPYIEEHISVKVPEPAESTKLKKRIREKEIRRKKVLAEIEEVEEFIDRMSEGVDKQIFEMIYLDGMTQKEVGDIIHLERSGISKKISAIIEDSQRSHF